MACLVVASSLAVMVTLFFSTSAVAPVTFATASEIPVSHFLQQLWTPLSTREESAQAENARAKERETVSRGVFMLNLLVTPIRTKGKVVF